MGGISILKLLQINSFFECCINYPVALIRLESLSKVTPVAILTLIINLTPISCLCTCSMTDLTKIQPAFGRCVVDNK